jgi:flagellum-specific ATP synthase
MKAIFSGKKLISRLIQRKNENDTMNMESPGLAEKCRIARDLLAQVDVREAVGRVAAAGPLTLETAGLRPAPARGDRIAVGEDGIIAEIVAVREERQQAIAFTAHAAPRAGSRLRWLGPARLDPSAGWLGRVVDPLGRALDGKGTLPRGGAPRRVAGDPPPPGARARLGARIGLGVRALDLFCTLRQGQRLGLFAASGIGKSTLLSMLAGAPDFDVVVLGLIGERGRELREFIEDDLGPERLARAVVVCATSDTAAPMRREAALAAMTVAEHFRDAGQRVLLLLDSVTRFALACREIGLAAGEPPATRGYPPSVFAELPRLLERAGPGPGGCAGSITLLATVLVEGDDHDEPIADAVRGILDGHVVLDRAIAERGRYPAVDVLRSLSRTVPGCLDAGQRDSVARARRVLAVQAEMAELVRLGAYRAGTDAEVDAALGIAPRIEALIAQGKGEATPLDASFAMLADALNGA